ncbi:MAG TPA: glutathione S-transferase family protein [Acidiferrobacterales bacterium]|nr:glutathione S-transferase family protein [Acidiferrobacterales bacterium]
MVIQLYDLAGVDENRRFSPYCWRIRMALVHKELQVQTIPWRFTDKAAIAFSGQGAVPVLVDGDLTVVDSWRIANYLEDQYPDRAPLFGCEAARHHALFIKLWVERVLNPLALRMVALDIFKHLHEKDRAYFRETREKRFGMSLEAYVSNREQARDGFREALAPLRAFLGEQPFLGGLKPLFADYLVFGTFQWMRCVSDFQVLAKDDPVYAWRARLLDLYGGLARAAVGYPV